MTNTRLYKGELASLSRYTSLSTHFLSSINDLSVVLTCLHAPLVPPRRLIVVVSEVVIVTPEHSLSPLPLNRSHRTDQMLSLNLPTSSIISTTTNKKLY